MDKLVVKELIQSELNKENLIFELNNIIKEKESIIKDYDKLINLLDKKGASKNTAQFISKTI
jgi:lipid A disaccharide synthetase